MRWLPALALFGLLAWVILEADLGKPNYFIQLGASMPYGDKIGHLLLFGVLALLLNFATKARQVAVGPLRLYLGVVLTLGFALLEEGSQLLFPSRSFELLDILADLLGVTLATLLTSGFYQLRARYRRRAALPTQQGDDEPSAS
ncbi:VanZ family protein [Rheinheimera texasensis]|uniref:VanZ family protein n=1 Tax=Rheinheimera texasensis TaxID=306205 RepID=UPI0032B21192